MKKLSSILIVALLITILILPVSKFIFSHFGYTFEFCSNTVYSAVIAVLSAVTLIISLHIDLQIVSKPMGVLIAIIPILNLISCIVYLFPIKTENKLMYGFALVSIVCSCALCALFSKPFVLQVTALVLSGLMIACVTFVGFLSLFFVFGDTTVVAKFDSPDGKCFAEVVSVDQGALGGDTCVYVLKNPTVIDAGVFKLYAKPRMVYFGEWYEYETIKVSWKDDDTLIIDSKEYDIK